jgi:hypothetical protein
MVFKLNTDEAKHTMTRRYENNIRNEGPTQMKKCLRNPYWSFFTNVKQQQMSDKHVK